MVREGDKSEEDEDERDANEEPNEEEEAVKAQVFHTILSVILKSLVEVIETGIIFDYV